MTIKVTSVLKTLKIKVTSVLLRLYCANIFLQTDTVYDFLRELQRSGRGSFWDQAVKALVGEIVLTRYNNKTYRIDDIEWSMSPQATFSTKVGDTSFVNYYKKNYNASICLCFLLPF